MKLFALALALLAASSALAAPIPNEDYTAAECYQTPSAHFCVCGNDVTNPGTLFRVDISGGQRIFTKLQSFNSSASCDIALVNRQHPACR